MEYAVQMMNFLDARKQNPDEPVPTSLTVNPIKQNVFSKNAVLTHAVLQQPKEACDLIRAQHRVADRVRLAHHLHDECLERGWIACKEIMQRLRWKKFVEMWDMRLASEEQLVHSFVNWLLNWEGEDEDYAFWPLDQLSRLMSPSCLNILSKVIEYQQLLSLASSSTVARAVTCALILHCKYSIKEQENALFRSLLRKKSVGPKQSQMIHRVYLEAHLLLGSESLPHPQELMLSQEDERGKYLRTKKRKQALEEMEKNSVKFQKVSSDTDEKQ